MRRARLVVLSCLLALFALPSGVWALSQGDLLVSDLSRRSIFQIDPETGDRTVISGCGNASCSFSVGGGAAMTAPSGLARASSLDPSIPFYVTDTFTDTLMRIDPATGFRTAVSSSTVGTGTAFVSPVSVSIRPDGNLLVVDEGLDALILVDATTGNRTILSSASLGSGTAFSQPHDLFIDANGDVLVLDTLLEAIFRVNVNTGDRTILSSLGTGSGPAFIDPQNIARDVFGNILVSDANAFSSLPGAIYSVDPVTGDRVLVTSDAIGDGRNLEIPVGMTLDALGNILVLDFAPGIVLSIDPLTGDRVVLSSSQRGTGLTLSGPSSIVSISIPQAVPEPGTALLLGFGLALLARNDPPSRRRH